MSVTVEPNVPEAEYHADEALSQSGAKLLLQSPALFRYRRDNPEQRDEFDYGHAAHAKVLGVGLDVVTVDATDWRTKAAREARDAARAEGKVALLPGQVAKIDAMAAAIEDHPGARAILRRDGQAEVSMWWDETTADTETTVRCRGRVDWLTATNAGEPIVVDYKTTVDASPQGFRRTSANYRYDMQDAAYARAVEAATGTRPSVVFIAQEKEPPYLVGLYALTPDFRDRGERDWLRAVDLFAVCTATGNWPGYAADVIALDPPSWAI